HVGAEAVQELGEVAGAGDVQSVDETGLGEVLLGDDRAGETVGAGGEQCREDPGDRPHPAVQTQLPQQHEIRGDVGEQVALGVQHGHRDGEIEAGAVLGPPGRAHVDGDPPCGEVDPAAGGGRAHAV